LLLISVLSIASGCRKEVEKERINSYYGKSYSEIFDAFWNGMNTNYMFWDIETVNWDNMYKTYKSRFEYLDQQKNDPQAAQKAAQYLVDMTKDLSDSHLNLTFNGFANYVIAGYPIQSMTFSPSGIRHQLRGDRNPIPRSTFDVVIPNNYLTKAETGTDGNGFRINLGIIPSNNKKILYLEYSAFQLGNEYYAPNSTTTPVKPVIDHFFQYTKDPSIDGLIIDLRGNPGGSIPDLDFLLGRLTTSQAHVCYTRTKNGNDRLDYTPWVKGYVHPQPGASDFTKPISVLVDMYSASMSEMTSLSIKAMFPKAKLVGEQTWGATGPIPSNDVRYLGGQFTAANFVQIYCSGVEYRDKNLVSYENKGITPDITVAYDTAAIKNNSDVQLNKALEYVNSH
jgi:hypothetical protein